MVMDVKQTSWGDYLVIYINIELIMLYPGNQCYLSIISQKEKKKTEK